MKEVLKHLLLEEDGQGMTEYALILGLIVFGVWAVMSATSIGDAITALFGNVKSEITKCSEDGTGCGTGTPGP